MSSFKWIKKPADVIQKNPITGEPLSDANVKPIGLKELWAGTLCHDKRVTQNFKNIRCAGHIADALDAPLKGKAYEWIKLTDADYDFLKPIVEEPTGLRGDKENGYPGGVFVQLLPLLTAIMDAVSEEPDDLKVDIKPAA